MNFFFIIFFIVFFCTGCLNSYEKNIIGDYKVTAYELEDSSKKISVPVLSLKKDKTFELSSSDKKTSGKWSANDYGDFTLVDFLFDNNDCQGKILGNNFEFIEVNHPSQMGINSFKSLTFQRINN